jgi:ribosomal protein S18 acetylase RimI-like enzyme
MIYIKTLEETPVAAIVHTFNEAFSDYIVPLQMTEENLLAKIRSEHIALSRSAGAFDDGRLIGFILMATGEIYGRATLYNGGTGVVPEYRGRRITEQLYAFIRSHIEKDEQQHLLEVITSNEKAVRVYSRIGLRQRRIFNCFKGNCIATPSAGLILKKAIVFPMFDPADFWDFEPSWQNSIAAITRALTDHTIFIITNGGRLLGYIVFAAATGRLKQLAVRKDQRRQGIGTTLLAAMNKALRGKEITAINVDSSDEGITAFFQANGLKPFIQQYEMIMP